MKGCPDLFLLAAIACKLADILSTEELEILGANLTALGDLLAVITAHSE